VLNASELTLWRGSNCLFENLSFELGAGRAMLIRGPNGSGKTTLLRVLAGLSRPESGRVTWLGESVDSGRTVYGQAMAWFGHASGLKADLTVAQNLTFANRLRGQDDSNLQQVLAGLDLDGQVNLEVRYLSAGQQRRTALARLLMSNAPLWLMDEPFTNLDDAGRQFMTAQLGEHIRQGGLAAVAAHHELELGSVPVDKILLGVLQ
jgi:heme exporter protein A